MNSTFITDLARPRPDPGGGAAAAHGAAVGLALMEKVVRLEQRRIRPRVDEVPDWGEFLARLQRLKQSLARLQEEDVQAYFRLVEARKGGDPEELAAALKVAYDRPRRIVAQAQEALELLGLCGGACRGHLVSDLLVAGEFLLAAARGAAHIAGANLALMPDADKCRVLAAELAADLTRVEEQATQVQAALKERTK